MFMVSLLARLIDDAPEQTKDINEYELKGSSIIEELLMLLSSRPRVFDDDLLKCSVINYGVCDVFPNDLNMVERQLILLNRIKDALKIFEPRLTNVDVMIVDSTSSETKFILEAQHAGRFIRYFLTWDDAISQFYLRE